jgi:large conductance mechanosensitive channel
MDKFPARLEVTASHIEHSTMSILGEFKAFISKGNVMDLAVGVIIGGAFQGIVTSLVKDVIMPTIGLFGGAPDFSEIAIGAHEVIKNGQPVLGPNGKVLLEGGVMIGNFLNAVVSFLILAAVVFFLLVKPMNKLMEKVNKPVPPPDAPPPPEDIILLREIRDSLKKPATP